MGAAISKGRVEKLIEQLDRQLDLTDTTLINVGASTFAGKLTANGDAHCEGTQTHSGSVSTYGELYVGESLSVNSEDLGDGATVSQDVVMSYFSTAGAETADLAVGASAGQVKMFSMISDSGNMVITCANPAWGGSGTLTFNAVGDGCTLVYAGSKWNVVGNNGVVLA